MGDQVVLDVVHIDLVDCLFAGYGRHREALDPGACC